MKNKKLLGIIPVMLLIAVAWAAPVVLDFDTYPGGNWQLHKSGGSSYVSDGILTIDAPADYHEFILWHPNDEWHQEVNNSRGWVIETRLRVDSSTEPFCGGRGPVQIWAHDHTNLVIIGFSTNEICIAYPDVVTFPMDTTDGFHVYRIESQFDQVKIYVDNILRIDHTLSWSGGGSNILMFGDGVSGRKSLSYWDYFWYDVFPEEFIPATIDIDPDTLNLKSKGKWITTYIEFPEGYNVEDIDCSTIKLEDEIGVESCDRPVESVVDDYDGDGIPDYMVKFDRAAVQDLLSPADEVELTITGELTDGTPFEGSDTIRVIDKGNGNGNNGIPDTQVKGKK